MAQPNNSFDTYDSVGNREDLFDTIYNVDPDDTPFLSKMGKVKAKNTNHEWQTDGLDAPSDDNAHIEGDDTVAGTVSPTVRLGNYTQIFKKPVTIPGTQEAITRAGRGREQAYQKLLKGKAMKTDMEMSAFANKAKSAGTGAGGRVLAGVPTWLTSNTSAGATGADATGDGTDIRTDGTQRAFTEAKLKTVLASVYDNSGKKPDCVFVGSHNKQIASGFTGASTRMDSGENAKVTAHVDVYEYDFGSVRFEPSRHVRSRDALVLTTDMWAWADLRPMFDEDLAKIGDSDRFQIIAESTLVCRNELANGMVADLTTS